MDRRAQVTIFIIVGILLLAIFAVVLYVTQNTVTTEFETEGRPVIQTVPQEFIALQEFTESCLQSVTEQGLVILGQQGGYIYPSSLGDFSPIDPTNADGLSLDPLLVPYWHYNAHENGAGTTFLQSLQPDLYDDEGEYMSIESQLARYVEEELGTCLQDYTAFAGQGYAVDLGDKSAQVRVFDGYVDVILDMPLAAERDGANADLETFYSAVNLDLKGLYEFADALTSAEQENYFLEYHTLNVLSLHTGLDPEKFPPTLALEYDEIVGTSWVTVALEEDLKDLLATYVPMLRYYGAENFHRHEYALSDLSDIYQQTSDDMILSLDSLEVGEYDLDAQGIAVNFDYFSWDPYLDLNAGDEQIDATSFYIDSPLPLFGVDISFNKYLNTYDISYPVLVTLQDENAFDGRGYSFSFALETNIINNEPVRSSSVTPAVIITEGQSLLCNPTQRETEMISSLIVDAYTHEPLELVQFGFSIPNDDRCLMGATEEDGGFSASYPAAYGGMLDLRLDGYLTEYFSLDTYPFKEESAVIGYAVAGVDAPVFELYPVKELAVSVQKKNVGKCIQTVDVDHCVASTSAIGGFNDCADDPLNRVCFFNSAGGLFLPEEPDIVAEANGSKSYLNEYYFTTASHTLAENEEVFVIMERVTDVIGEVPGTSSDEFSAVFSVTGDAPSTVELVPGVYKVTTTAQIYLNDGEPYVIPSDHRCLNSRDADCFEIEGAEVESLLGSTMQWHEESTYVTITEEDLYSANEFVFYTLMQDWQGIPEVADSIDFGGSPLEVNGRMVEDFTVIDEVTLLANRPDVRSALEPSWIKIDS